MIFNFKTFKIIKESSTYTTDAKEHPFKRFSISKEMKNAEMYNRENQDLFKYIYKQGLEKVTKKIDYNEYSITYNIIVSNEALSDIAKLEINKEEVLDYVEMAIPYMSKSLISDSDFVPTNENLFYFEGESYAFGFILNIQNQNIKATTGPIPDPIIDIVVTRVTTPENEEGIVYVHNTGEYKKLNF